MPKKRRRRLSGTKIRVQTNDRKLVFDTIRAGCRVTIVNRFGQEHTGRAVMRGPHGWVLNMGGRHGTPGIASESNVTKVRCTTKKK